MAWVVKQNLFGFGKGILNNLSRAGFERDLTLSFRFTFLASRFATRKESRSGMTNCVFVLSFALLAWAAPAQAAVFSPQTFTLSNGLQVVIVTNRLSPAVAQMVWYKVGAIDDLVDRSGTAHYLEHMMFKGTQEVPAGAFSQILAAQGGDENAFTTHDTTAYHEIVAADRLALVMQLEADRMRNLTLLPDEATPELAVVLSERQERTDNNPAGLFQEKMAAALFGKQPYGRPVIGWRKDIERIAPLDAMRFYRAHYAPNNAVLVVSGNVEVSEVLRLASGTFGRLPAQPVAPRPTFGALAVPRQKRVEMQDSRVTQPSFIQMISMPSAKQDQRRADALEVLAELLSGGEVGLLYQHFVVQKNSASGIDASYDSLSLGPTLFSLSATPSPKQDVRALEVQVKSFLHRLAAKGVSSRDVAAAKQRMEDSAIFARDRLMAPAQILGRALAVGEPLASVENWPERIRAVTVDDVNKALSAVLARPYQVTGILEPAPRKEAP